MRLSLLLFTLQLACSPAERQHKDEPTGQSTPAEIEDSSSLISVEECREECEAKAESCGAPGVQAVAICDEICSAPITSTQLHCLGDASCTLLMTALTTGAPVCGIGEEPATNAQGSGGPGSVCHCTQNTGAAPSSYSSCEGTSSGCEFGNGTICISEAQTGLGTCEYGCSSSEAGSQGTCPDSMICLGSGLWSTANQEFYLCE